MPKLHLFESWCWWRTCDVTNFRKQMIVIIGKMDNSVENLRPIQLTTGSLIDAYQNDPCYGIRRKIRVRKAKNLPGSGCRNSSTPKKLLPVPTGLVAKSMSSPEMFRYSMACSRMCALLAVHAHCWQLWLQRMFETSYNTVIVIVIVIVINRFL